MQVVLGDHAIYYNNGLPTIFHGGSDQLNGLSSEQNSNIIFSATYDTGLPLLQQHIDGRLIGTNGGVSTYVDPGATSVGSWQGGSNMVGNIAEVIMFDAELSATDRRRVESYLAVKYGIFP